MLKHIRIYLFNRYHHFDDDDKVKMKILIYKVQENEKQKWNEGWNPKKYVAVFANHHYQQSMR